MSDPVAEWLKTKPSVQPKADDSDPVANYLNENKSKPGAQSGFNFPERQDWGYRLNKWARQSPIFNNWLTDGKQLPSTMEIADAAGGIGIASLAWILGTAGMAPTYGPQTSKSTAYDDAMDGLAAGAGIPVEPREGGGKDLTYETLTFDRVPNPDKPEKSTYDDIPLAAVPTDKLYERLARDAVPDFKAKPKMEELSPEGLAKLARDRQESLINFFNIYTPQTEKGQEITQDFGEFWDKNISERLRVMADFYFPDSPNAKFMAEIGGEIFAGAVLGKLGKAAKKGTVGTKGQFKNSVFKKKSEISKLDAKITQLQERIENSKLRAEEGKAIPESTGKQWSRVNQKRKAELAELKAERAKASAQLRQRMWATRQMVEKNPDLYHGKIRQYIRRFRGKIKEGKDPHAAMQESLDAMGVKFEDIFDEMDVEQAMMDDGRPPTEPLKGREAWAADADNWYDPDAVTERRPGQTPDEIRQQSAVRRQQAQPKPQETSISQDTSRPELEAYRERVEAQRQRVKARTIELELTKAHTKKDVAQLAREAKADPDIDWLVIDGKKFAAGKSVIVKAERAWKKAQKEALPDAPIDEPKPIEEPVRPDVVEETVKPTPEPVGAAPVEGNVFDISNPEHRRKIMKQSKVHPDDYPHLEKIMQETPDYVDKPQVKEMIEKAGFEVPKKKASPSEALTQFHTFIGVPGVPRAVKDFFRKLGKDAFTSDDVFKNKALWRETGLWIGLDGHFKREISDYINIYEPNNNLAVDWGKLRKEKEGLWLPEVYQNDALYEAVPGLKDVGIKIDPILAAEGSFYSPEYKAILLKDPYSGRALVHEIQHAVNHITDSQLRGTASETVGSPVKYLYNPGEVEARLVERRMKMSEKAQKREPPWETLEKMLAEETKNIPPKWQKEVTDAVSSLGDVLKSNPNELHSFLGVPPQAGKILRKIMQKEHQARGKGDGSINSRVLRAGYWRGQKTSPKFDEKTGKWFVERDDGSRIEMDLPTGDNFVRAGQRNMGETGHSGEGAEMRGVSMSLMPDESGAVKFSKQKANSLSEPYEPGIVRVMPLYGTKPEKVILDMTKPEHRKVMKEAYEAAVRKTTDKEIIPTSYEQLKESVFPNTFNRALTEYLESKGWKGILHSPHRYGEYELQIFNPKNVLFLEEPRGVRSDPAIKRLWDRTPADKAANLPEIFMLWEDMDFKSEALNLLDRVQELSLEKTLAEDTPLPMRKKASKLRSDADTLAKDIIDRPYDEAFFDQVQAILDRTHKLIPKEKTRRKAGQGSSRQMAQEWADHTATKGLGDKETSALGEIYKSIDFKALADLLKSDPNALGSNLGNLKLFEAVAKDAESQGISIRKLLMRRGVTRQQAIKTEREIKALLNQYKTETGEPIHAAGFGRWKGEVVKNADNPKPTVTKPMLDVIFNGTKKWKGKGESAVRGIIRTFTPNERNAETFFGKRGPELITVPVRHARAAETIEGQMLKARTKRIHKGMKGKERQRVGAYAISVQERGADILAKQGVDKPPKWEDLSPKEQTAYTELRKIFDELGPRLNEDARIPSGLEPIKLLEDYFPFMIDALKLNENQFKIVMKDLSPLKLTIDPDPMASVKQAKLTRPAFVRRRTGRAHNVATDSQRIADMYIAKALHYIHITPVVAQLNQLLGQFKGSTLPTPIKPTLSKKGKPIETMWSISDHSPEAHAWLSKYLEDISFNRDRETFGPRTDKAIKYLNQNVVASIMGGSIRTMLIQPSQLLSTFSYLDADAVALGAWDVFNSQAWESTIRNSEQLKLRKPSYDAAMMSFEEGYANRALNAQQKIGKLALSHIAVVDYMSSWIAARSAYHYIHKQMRKGKLPQLKKHEVWERVDQIVERTQGSGERYARAPIQQSVGGKTLTLFQTFAIAHSNFLLRDIVGAPFKEGMTKAERVKALTKPIKYGIGMYYMNHVFSDILGMNDPIPDPVGKAVEAYLETGEWLTTFEEFGVEFASLLPVLASVRYGSSVAGALLDNVQKLMSPEKENIIREIIEAPDPAAALEAIITNPQSEAALTLGGFVGINQLEKSYSQYLQGKDGWNVFTGEDASDYEGYGGRRGKGGDGYTIR